MTYYPYISVIGPLYILEESGTLLGISLTKPHEDIENTELIRKVSIWLDNYFNKKSIPIDFHLKFEGTTFQQKVYKELIKIPFGKTITYGELAHRLKSSPRAVGGALGKNEHLIIIPCHRVVSKTGLGGFSGGLEIKKALLALEEHV